MKHRHLIFGILILALAGACSSGKAHLLRPTKTLDPDMANIPEPKSLEENQIWDIVDMTFFYQVGKALDLNWVGHKLGRGLGISKGRLADNVNKMDEVPNSSWYTARHYHHPMSIAALKRGPNLDGGPDLGGKWTIIRGKFEGGTPGFTIRDRRGDSYIIKFDALGYQEMGSSAEVISTKILHAAGYFVPQNTIEFIHPDSLLIAETVKYVEGGVKRPMTREDLKHMLANTPRRKDGSVRVLASKYVDGKPVGVWEYRGRRPDDPNDRVDHQHRRELRGLRTISAWLNDADRRAANTLAVYTKDPVSGNQYIKHYIIDMGSTLGSNNIIPHAPKYGNEYLFDPRTIAHQYLTLGFRPKAWEFETGHLNPQFPSVGYFEGEIFEPGDWYPTYANPAFEFCNDIDAFWGAKIVMSFSDEAIRAIVEEARMSNPAAAEHLIETLIRRRDKIGRHWFSRINPVDRFRFEADSNLIRFDDLALLAGFAATEETRYEVSFCYDGKEFAKEKIEGGPKIVLTEALTGMMERFAAQQTRKGETARIFTLRLKTWRGSQAVPTATTLHFWFDGPLSRILGIERDM
ncbi:MAG TPA: hypothetical protein PKV71_08275 [Calditrichia bacterium]|nr:hypothetical protein [Calditrichota bacterium]HQV31857.1 hypothetical protein [Calditrichia bacterium]